MPCSAAVSTWSGRYNFDSNAVVVFRSSSILSRSVSHSRAHRRIRLAHTVAADSNCSKKPLGQVEMNLLVEFHTFPLPVTGHDPNQSLLGLPHEGGPLTRPWRDPSSPPTAEPSD